MATLLKELYVGNATGRWYLSLYEDSFSQSIDGNYTNVNLRLTLRADSSTWVEFDNRDAWIHGTHFTIAYHHDNKEHNLGSMTLKIDHNANGEGSYQVGFGIATSFALNGSGVGGRTLPTIPRASSFSITGNALGSTISVNITRASTSFTHLVRYQFGSISRDYSGQAITCSFIPPLSDASQIPNSTSGTGTINVYTYSGSTLIGSKSTSFTLNLPSDVIPSFESLQIARIDNGVPAEWGIFVQGKTTSTISIVNASGIYGSLIKTYSINGGGYSTSTNSFTTGTLNSGNIIFTGTITDTRGRSCTKQISIKVYENAKPSLTLQAIRCTSEGKVDNNGTYLKITPIYRYADINGNNYISSKEFCIKDTPYVNTTASTDSSFVLGDGDVAISKSYEVTGKVTDALGQSNDIITVRVASSSVPFNLREDKTGVGIGKYGERENAIDSDWDIYIRGKKLITSTECPFPIGYIMIEAMASYNPNEYYPNTKWERYAKGRTLIGINEDDSSFNSVGKIGGHKSMQKHTHSASTSSAGNHTHRYKGFWTVNSIASSYQCISQTQLASDPWASPSSQEGAGAHTHAISVATSGDGDAQNMPPYIAVYMWIRTA